MPESKTRATPRVYRKTPRKAAVIGGGISGLLAARDLQAAGWQVGVYDAAASWGGCVGVHEVAGTELDSGAESFATRNTAVVDLATELGLGEKIVTPNPAGAWVWLPDGPVPLPKTGVLGIPSDVRAPEVRKALGQAGVLRASLDARMPATVGTSEETMSVAELVRLRMGSRVLERLVAPVVGGVHSADPELLDVDMVAPGLRAGIREHGSLAAAVAAQRAGGAKPGSAVAGLRGGMHQLVSALVESNLAAGVALHSSHEVTGMTRVSGKSHESKWRISWTSGETSGSEEVDVVVVATDGPTAISLLAPEIPELEEFAPHQGPDIRLVTLVVDLPELDSAPRGTGILVAPGLAEIKAKALTHATAKWEWLADETGPGTHVLRLSYGRAGVLASDAVRLTPKPQRDEDLIAQALKDASTLLGVDLVEADLLGSDVVRWKGALPFAAVGHMARVAQIQRIVNQHEGVVLTGGWVAGNGLAAVVGGTRRAIRAVVDAARSDQATL